MTIYEAMYAPIRQPLLTIFLLLLILQMYLLFASFRDGRKRPIKIWHLVYFLISASLLYLQMLEISWGDNYPDGIGPVPVVLAVFRPLPVLVIIIYEIITAFILAAEFRELFYYRKNHLTSACIKETMDLLPAGIAFGKTDGAVSFINVVMDHLSHRMTGKRITSLPVFWKSISGEKENSEANSPRPAALPVREEKYKTEKIAQVKIPDDSGVWQFVAVPPATPGEPYIQLIATDITREAQITQELEVKNIKLRDLHMRLSIYNKQADRIIIAQELLAARMTVHNEVGNVLLESRHYLKDPASFDEALLLQALKNTNTYLLREYEEDDTMRDSLTDAMEMAEAIGVDVEIAGLIPAEDPERVILAAAIKECAANTVKHAGGDRLSVNIQNIDGKTMYTLQNNGIQPSEPVHESGGLLSLRSLVEKENGTMQIEISLAFKLIITLS